MFTLILPQNRPHHQRHLARMFADRAKADPRFDAASDGPESVYIVYEDKKRNLFGSCRVNPLRQSLLRRVDLVDERACDTLKLMEVSCIVFDEEGVLDADPNKALHVRWFYEGLAIMLETLSVSLSLKGFFCVSSPEVHERCTQLGAWHFVSPIVVPSPEDQIPLHAGFLVFDHTNTLARAQPVF